MSLTGGGSEPFSRTGKGEKPISEGICATKPYDLARFLPGLPGHPARTTSNCKKPIETRKYKTVPEAYQRGRIGPETRGDFYEEVTDKTKKKMVGMRGFEPPAPCSRSKCTIGEGEKKDRFFQL